MKTLLRILLASGLLFALSALSFAASSDGGKTVIIIRHAEDGEGPTISNEGDARAAAWAQYFKAFRFNGQSLQIGYLFAAIDSDNSQRPRLTLEPTAAALGLPIDSDYKTKQVEKLAAAVRALPAGAVALVAWRHSRIPDLISSFGADPNALLPDGRWPGKVYDWLIVLQFDPQGHVTASQRLSLN